MGQVKERIFNKDGSTDVLRSFDDAEKITGFRLDRRKNYLIAKGEIRQLKKWTQVCSGCSDDSEYSSPSRGAGCHECGYHGVTRVGMYLPLAIN